jgi:hypothetical protein
VAKESAEVEETRLILEETLDSIKRLNDQIEQVKGGKDELMKKVEKEWLHTGVSIVLTLGTQSIT